MPCSSKLIRILMDLFLVLIFILTNNNLFLECNQDADQDS